MPHVQVIVRCRPPLSGEQSMTCSKIETNEVSNTVTINSSKNETAKNFTFDRVLSESCSQEEMFASVSPMVDHALEGLHSTIFAYGQTGSGKTHTIEGFEYMPDQLGRLRPKLDSPPSRHGVLPRIIQAVFDRCRDRMGHNPNVQYRIKCSFMQLYNERVSDLLNPSTRAMKEGLKIRWTRDDHFEVENLYVFECDSADQMREMLMMGVKEKVMSSHQMNSQSSRSHCIFTIYVHSWDPSNADCVVKSELSVVDLAGSEKLALLSANPSPQLLKESIEINTSLLSLGKVITALASNSKNNSHVPYRDSKLTKLLKHALGGNSMTCMVACISSLDAYVEETLSTLLYAGRARNITTVPKINEDPRSALIRQLREEIASLKAELEYYKQLAGGAGGVESRIQTAFLGPSLTTSAVRNSDGMPSSRKEVPNNNTVGLANRPHSSDDSTSQQLRSAGNGDDDLADKLLAACKMLKNVVTVNNQLRTAFDKLKVAKEESTQREVELNAENIALRERIEMLESIALNDEMGATIGSGSVTTSSSAAGVTGSSSLQSASSRKLATNADADLLGAYGKSTRPPPPQEDSSRWYPHQNAPSQARVVEPPPSHPPARGAAADRLRDYAAKYRNPQKPTRYEDYYGQAKKAAPSSSTTQANQAVQELDRLMKNAPRSTIETLPASLAQPGAYGSLSFGGSGDETRDLEERRRQRQRKLQQLQEQHDHMQRGFSGGVVQLPSAGGPEYSSMSSARLDRQYAPPLEFGQTLPPTSMAANTPQHGLTQSTSTSSSTAKLFNYLSQDEASKMFTPEQQERLRMRGLASQAPSVSASQVSTAAGRGAAVQPSPRDRTEALTALQRQLDALQASGRR